MRPGRFTRFATIDWSGAAGERLPGIAVAVGEADSAAPRLCGRSGGWSRGDILAQLCRWAEAGEDVLIGVDFAPAAPFLDQGAFFPEWADSPPDARSLWGLVDQLSADTKHFGADGFLAHPEARRYFRQAGQVGDRFGVGRGRLRECELSLLRSNFAPSSVFNLVGAAQVGKSSLTGMRVLHALGRKIPMWPFDLVPERGPVLVEIYPAIASRKKLRNLDDLNAGLARWGSDPYEAASVPSEHSADAVITAAWMRAVAHQSELWNPLGLTDEIKSTEGWTFGA